MALHHRLIGKAARLFSRVRRARTLGVRAILRDSADRIALVRHTYGDYWYLPGGGVKKGEDFVTALHRELEEEVGITGAAIERLVGVYHSRREGKDDHVLVFALRAPDGAVLRKADTLEIEAVGWFAPDALPAETSPATRRRIDELDWGTLGSGDW